MPEHDDPTIPPSSDGSEDATQLPTSEDATLPQPNGDASDHTTDYANRDKNPSDDNFSTLQLGIDDQISGQRPTPKSIQYFGDYEVIHEIARGGMGVVYKARQKKLNRLVAVKMILSGELASEEAISRFFAEAQAAATLDHPGIVPVYEIGQHDGQHYFSMGYIEGKSLADRVRNGPLPPAEAAEITRKIAEAIAYAHEKGVIHRDLKPANVLMDTNGEPKVTDFGLARIQDQSSGMTRTGAVMGTPSYMPPEQAAGKTHDVGPLSDVYSLGALLYCLLTGRPPFQAATPLDTLMQVIEKEPVSVQTLNSGVPQDLETICHKCLQKEPAKRYASAQAFGDDLGRWLRGEPIQARAVSRFERGWRWVKRNPVLSGSLAASIGAILLGSALSLWFGLEARRAETNARNSERDAVSKSIQAEQSALEARRNLYLGHMNSVQINWEFGNVQATNALLNRYRSQIGPSDLRGFEWYYYDRLANSALNTIETTAAHQQSLKTSQVSFNGDGISLAATSNSQSIRLFDLLTNRERSLDNETLSMWPFQSPRLSADGKYLLANNLAGKIALWDTALGQRLGIFEGPEGLICEMLFSETANRFAVASLTGGIKVYDIPSREQILSINVTSQLGFRVLLLSSDGDQLAIATQPSNLKEKTNSLIVYDILSGDKCFELNGHPMIDQVAFNIDRSRIFVISRRPEIPQPSETIWSGWDNPNVPIAIEIFDLGNGKLDRSIGRAELDFRPDSRFRPIFSPDRATLAIIDQDGIIRLLNTNTFKQVMSTKSVFPGQADLFFSSDNGLIAAAKNDGKIVVFSATTGEVVAELKGHAQQVGQIAFSLENNQLASTCNESVMLWDLTLQDQEGSLWIHPTHKMIFSPDGRELATCSSDGSIRVWDSVVGLEKFSLPGHSETVCELAFSPDGKQLASASSKSVKLWDLATSHNQDRGEKASVLSINAGSNAIASTFAILRFVPNKNQLLAYWGGNIRRYDIGDNQLVEINSSHIGPVHALSSDGRRAITSSGDGSGAANIIDLEAPGEALAVAGHPNRVLLASAFSPDGKRFATGSHNDPVKFWDVTTGEQLFSFPVNSKFASILQFSPDGTRLAVSSGDGTIKLRDLLTGEEAATFKVGGAVSEGDSVSCIVFSPDGKRIAASTSKGVSILDARPWNQETRTEQQALCLVRGALRKCDSEESLRKIIRENVTFTEQAREKALEFAPLFWQSRVKALR